MSPRRLTILLLCLSLLALAGSRVRSEPAAPGDAPLRTRARMDSEAIVQAYSTAIQYYNDRLTEAQRTTLSRHVFYYSVHRGLDARLVIAVLAVEGHLKHVAESKNGLRMDGRPEQEGIDHLTRDLATRIQAESSTGRAVKEGIAAALRARAKHVLHRKSTADAYVKQVMTTYSQLPRGDVGSARP